MKKINWSILISLIALVVSIISLCNVYPRELGLDYLGLIVGILALITAILLGWNIYTIIDIKENYKRYSDILNEVDFAQHKQIAYQEYTNWMIYHKLLTGKDPNGLEYSFLHHAASCLYHTSCIKEFDTCRAVVKGMDECLYNPMNIKMKKENIAILLSILQKVRHQEKIEGYSGILLKVLAIQAE